MDQSEQLKGMTADQLAMWQSGWKERSHDDILAEKEWQRRFMEMQHAHDRELLKPQIRWMKMTILVGFIGALIGATVTLAAALLGQSRQARTPTYVAAPAK